MRNKTKTTVMLDLGQELSRVEMKSVIGGVDQTICSGGTYNIGCSPGYCSGAGHGTFLGCNPPQPPQQPSGNYTQCTGGTYAIGCQQGYCAGASHGSFVTCHN